MIYWLCKYNNKIKHIKKHEYKIGIYSTNHKMHESNKKVKHRI